MEPMCRRTYVQTELICRKATLLKISPTTMMVSLVKMHAKHFVFEPYCFVVKNI